MNPVGEPDAGNPHVRFDERGGETERRPRRHCVPPRLYRPSERHSFDEKPSVCLAAKYHFFLFMFSIIL